MIIIIIITTTVIVFTFLVCISQVDVPESVSMRYDHSVAILSMTHNRVWIIVNGGCDKYNKPDNTNTFITGINVTMLVELGML